MKPSREKKRPVLIKEGSIFMLGSHRLACGDAKEEVLIKKLFGKERTDLVLTDPPYGVAYVEGKQGYSQSSSKKKVILNDHLQSDAEYTSFTEGWLKAVKPHLSKKNICYIFNSDKMLFSLREGMVQAGWKLAQLLVWVKTQAVIGRMDHLPQHEYIAYGWCGTHNFRKSKDKSVLVYPKPSKNRLHPTMKPVGLLRRLVLNASDTGSVVYDPFGGSGSTLIACEDTRRRCFMVEMDSEYCTVIIKRWERHTGQKVREG